MGQLAGVGRLLPNPDLLIRPYLLREALSSTRIEGTQATMTDVLEAGVSGDPLNPDVEEVVNYMRAMRTGIERLRELPLSVRLLREIHRELMIGVRGEKLAPGELRRSQNWIGPPGATIETATFVPPPHDQIADLLTDWERFANEETELPLLIQNALLHSQFETIHPFLDGNGRLGRLVIVFFLVAWGRLPAPLLYLSAYLDAHRSNYYMALRRIQEDGDPIPWFDLFLTSVYTQANDAVARADRILEIREGYRRLAGTSASPNSIGVVELACVNPILTTKLVQDDLGVSKPTALRLLSKMSDLDILSETGQGPRAQRRYVAQGMMDAVMGDGDE